MWHFFFKKNYSSLVYTVKRITVCVCGCVPSHTHETHHTPSGNSSFSPGACYINRRRWKNPPAGRITLAPRCFLSGSAVRLISADTKAQISRHVANKPPFSEAAPGLRCQPASGPPLFSFLLFSFFFSRAAAWQRCRVLRRHKRPQMRHMTPVPRENARGFINHLIEILFHAGRHAAARLPAWEELKRLFDLSIFRFCCLSPV